MQVTDLELKGHTLVKGTGKGGDALQYVSRHLGFGELISGPQTPISQISPDLLLGFWRISSWRIAVLT